MAQVKLSSCRKHAHLMLPFTPRALAFVGVRALGQMKASLVKGPSAKSSLTSTEAPTRVEKCEKVA